MSDNKRQHIECDIPWQCAFPPPLHDACPLKCGSSHTAPVQPPQVPCSNRASSSLWLPFPSTSKALLSTTNLSPVPAVCMCSEPRLPAQVIWRLHGTDELSLASHPSPNSFSYYSVELHEWVWVTCPLPHHTSCLLGMEALFTRSQQCSRTELYSQESDPFLSRSRQLAAQRLVQLPAGARPLLQLSRFLPPLWNSKYF